MRAHPYLRAYMAGIVVPTVFLMVIMIVYVSFRFYFEVPSQFVFEMPAWPLSRALLFPMAVVPNLWGLWNMLYLLVRARVRLSLGAFGALLPLLLFAGGVTLVHVQHLFPIQLRFALPAIPIGMAVYYLAWKFFVGFLNVEVGIA